MGIVYQARLLGTTLVVALKQVRTSDRGGPAAQRFREEIESAAGLRHPNIVPVYHVGEHDGQPFFTMALVEGGSLDKHISQFADDPGRVAALVAKVACGVHHAHQRRVLHRDLKPSNILLDEAGEPQVADFGLAAHLDDSGTATAAGPAGSLPWMAPESVRGEALLTTAVDVWALGVILYELLTGQRPFVGTDATAQRTAIVELTPVPPRTLKPHLSRDLDAICRRCLEKDPHRRYESAAAVALDLERWLRDEPVRARPAGRLERFTRWCRRNPGLAGGLLTLVCVLAAGTAASLSFIQDQDAAVRQAVCRANEYAAGHVANSVLRRLDELSQPVVAAVRTEELREACRKEDAAEARAALEKSIAPPRDQSSPFASVYLIKPDGHILALMRPGVPNGGLRPEVLERSFLRRDYFQGALRNRNKAEGGTQVHVSRTFTSEHDDKDKLAVACPVPSSGKEGTWVLAATITTDQTLGLINLQGQQHKAVLIAPRDTSSRGQESGGDVILVHPAFVAGHPAVSFRAAAIYRGQTTSRNSTWRRLRPTPDRGGRGLSRSGRRAGTSRVRRPLADRLGPRRPHGAGRARAAALRRRGRAASVVCPPLPGVGRRRAGGRAGSVRGSSVGACSSYSVADGSRPFAEAFSAQRFCEASLHACKNSAVNPQRHGV